VRLVHRQPQLQPSIPAPPVRSSSGADRAPAVGARLEVAAATCINEGTPVLGGLSLQAMLAAMGSAVLLVQADYTIIACITPDPFGFSSQRLIGSSLLSVICPILPRRFTTCQARVHDTARR